MPCRLPQDVDIPTWNSVKGILRKCETKYCQRIHICRNDCIAYWNAEHLPESYRHAHRNTCPVCGEARYVVDPQGGAKRAAKVCIMLAYIILGNHNAFICWHSIYYASIMLLLPLGRVLLSACTVRPLALRPSRPCSLPSG